MLTLECMVHIVDHPWTIISDAVYVKWKQFLSSSLHFPPAFVLEAVTPKVSLLVHAVRTDSIISFFQQRKFEEREAKLEALKNRISAQEQKKNEDGK